MPFKRTLVISMTALMLTACAVGPDYIEPSSALPTQFMGQSAIAERSAGAPANLASWWTAFGDAQLSQFVRLALEQNLDIAQAAARITQTRAGLSAANAALMPSANLTGQAARSYQSIETPLGRVLNVTPNFDRLGTAYEADLGGSWEVDLFGGLRRGQEAARADYQASEAGAAATRLAVAAQTADVYLNVRGLQTRLGISRHQVRTQQELLSMINMLYGKGIAAELQVRQAEGSLARVRASIPVLETGLDAAMNAMDVMLGTPPGTHRKELVEARLIPVAPAIGAVGSPNDLLRRRPDLIVAERRLAASNARIGAAMAEFYPKLSLGALIGSATTISAGNWFSAGAGQATGVLGVRWRLFDFGRINAQIKLAKGQEAEMLAAYRQSVLRASEDVENALFALLKREEQTIELTKGVDSLGRARESVFAAYQKGVVSLIEVLQADDMLLNASDARAQAQIESVRAAVAAYKALGGGWQEKNLAEVMGVYN